MRRLRPEHLPGLVARIYEAAARPELWGEVLHEIAEITGAEGAILFYSRVEQSPELLHSEALKDAIASFVRDGWHLRNDRLQRGLVLQRLGQSVVTEGMLFSREEYAREPMHMDLLRPHGLGHFAGLTVAHAPSADILLSIERSGGAEPYSDEEVRLLTKVLPHIQRAGQFALAVGLTHGSGVLDAFSLLDRPALLLDPFRNVVRLNAAAEHLLGRDLFVVQGVLTARDRVANAGLQRLIGEVLAGVSDLGTATAPVAVPRTIGRPLVVHGAALVGSARDPFQAAKAVVTIIDPDAGRERSELVLQQACALTAAEATTALHLSRGLSPEQIADIRGVGIETTRWQLKSIAAKTGTHGRGAQVALLNRILLGVLRA